MDPRKFMAFGSGIGIEAGAVESRSYGITRAAAESTCWIQPPSAITASAKAAEWGSEYAHFLKSAGAGHLTATVLIPRRDTIARYVALNGVAHRDMEAAIKLQIDTMTLTARTNAAYAWSRAGNGALVESCRSPRSKSYRTLFEEAGIAVGAFTFSASVLYASRRLPVGSQHRIRRPGWLSGAGEDENGSIEAYGESPRRPLFSAEFDTGAGARNGARRSRVAPAAGDCRAAPRRKFFLCHATNPVGNDLARRALPFAAALAGACPWLTPAANLLPAELPQFHSRARLVPSLVLAGVLLLVAGGLFAHSALEDRRYLGSLEAQIRNSIRKPGRRWRLMRNS